MPHFADGMLYLHSTVWDKAFSEARNEVHVFTDAWTETVEMGDAPSNDLAGSDASLPAQLQALHSFCAEVAAKVLHFMNAVTFMCGIASYHASIRLCLPCIHTPGAAIMSCKKCHDAYQRKKVVGCARLRRYRSLLTEMQVRDIKHQQCQPDATWHERG